VPIETEGITPDGGVILTLSQFIVIAMPEFDPSNNSSLCGIALTALEEETIPV
jgi:hypothetical protein